MPEILPDGRLYRKDEIRTIKAWYNAETGKFRIQENGLARDADSEEYIDLSIKLELELYNMRPFVATDCAGWVASPKE